MIKLDLKPSDKTLRQFAWVALVGLPMLAFVVLRIAGAFAWDHPAMLATAGYGVLQLVAALAGLRWLTYAAYVVVSLVGIPLGFVISQVLMAIIYYFVVTPIALVMRLTGRDVIGKRPDPNATSYWRERSGPRRPSSYFKLY